MRISKIQQSLLILLSTLALFASYPYVFGQFLSLPNPILLNGIILITALFIIHCFGTSLSKFPNEFNVIIIIQFIGYFLLGLIHGDKLDFVRCYFLVVVYLLLLCIYSSGILLKYIKFNNSLIALQCIMGVLAFVLYFTGNLSPLFPFENTDGRIAYCFGLTCSNAVVDNVIRVAGYFDEPGALAFWGIYALILNKEFVQNRMIEVILIFGLLFTLSAAYYIQILLYIMLYYGLSLKKNKGLLLVVLSSLIGFYIFAANNKDSTLNDLTIGRFEFNNGVTIESERKELAERAKDVFETSPIFGVGQTSIRSGEYMGDNEYELLASDGIIGMVIIYFPLLLVISRKRKRKKFLFASFILFVGYLQRPFHCSIIHFSMFYLYVLSAILYKYNRLNILCK